jgi:hypothetical protein
MSKSSSSARDFEVLTFRVIDVLKAARGQGVSVMFRSEPGGLAIRLQYL